MSEPRFTNRLVDEKSPYLQQHAHNPVDWHPWGEAAFRQATAEDKPIFLSIGYSTCHWCHVMERESFEDVEVAAVLNSVCIPIKVDREERPDVDQVYMGVCQALTGSGGWPLNVLLTPERVPFFAGTYFPKHSVGGRLGLIELLRQVGALWKQDPDKVRRSGGEIVAQLRAARERTPPSGGLDADLLRTATAQFDSKFDARHGGFGPAPKFPTPHTLTFLLGRYRRTGERQVLHQVEETLLAMRRGGLFDQLGYGFHRYSTDAGWLLPHFEKMLYDQAGLALAYLDAYRVTGRPVYRDTARETFIYVLRDLTSAQGAFYSAEDADSEGVEGKFYVWRREEILELLGPADGELFCTVYGIRPEGNFREEATGHQTGLNIPHLEASMDVLAARLDTPPEELAERLERARHILFQAREERVRPHRDEKILTAWNGLMISALARGAWVLDDPQLLQAARRAAAFLTQHLHRDGQLLRRYRDGDAAILAFAEDHAFLARAFLDLYAADFDPGHMAQSLELAEVLATRFWDPQHGGLFDTAEGAEELIFRPREVYDGATPSANSVALEVFSRLGLLTAAPHWTDRARQVAEAWAGQVGNYPAGFSQFLQGAALLLEPTREVVLVAGTDAEATRRVLAPLRTLYAPELSLVVVTEDGAEALGRLAPHTRTMVAQGAGPTAYPCEGTHCGQPLTSPEELHALCATPP